eukprot:227453-Chlamydomonas_euryale.AAC.1
MPCGHRQAGDRVELGRERVLSLRNVQHARHLVVAGIIRQLSVPAFQVWSVDQGSVCVATLRAGCLCIK